MTRSPGNAAAIARQISHIELIANATPAPSAALQRLADATRALGRWLTTVDDAVALEPLAAELEALVARLPGAGPDGACAPTRFAGQGELDPERPLPNPRGTHPLVGCTSPVAPPLQLRVDGGRVVADVTFGPPFEGNRGWVHGGFVAAGFDIVVVTSARLSGLAGPTGTLEVRYVAPTPVGEPLRYVGWPEAVDGRKVRVRARLERVADGRVTAEAGGIVVAPRPLGKEVSR